ncbi:MAG: type III secretion system chaperone [Planctomycetaceae bacterium]|nr:type III secretion system chaperone [Planctomycetaceae bacterium]
MMSQSRRNWIKNFALAGATVSLTAGTVVRAEEQEVPGMTDEQLEKLIVAQGLKPTKLEQRFDFGFKATLEQDQWELSMSAVLSQDGQSIWLMAWLDELPKSSADVPRTALLRLLAANDKMGNGKFFAYIATNRRFVLQRVIPTKDLTATEFRLSLQDLGATVVETYPQWTVSNWKADGEAQQTGGSAPAQTRSADNDSKFKGPVNR